MTYAPATLTALGALWVSHGGSNLGIVGSASHLHGYHLGLDRITAGGGAATDYSLVHFPLRDKAHATNAAMAIDLGPGSHPGMEVTYAKWLIAECQKGAPDTADIRAVNYERLRWDRRNGQASAVYVHDTNEAGHNHTEWFRDSETRDKTAAMRRYFGGEIVKSYAVPKVPATGYIGAGKTIYPNSDFTGVGIVVNPGRSMPYHGAPFTGVRQVARIDDAGINTGQMWFIKAVDLTNIVAAPGPVAPSYPPLPAVPPGIYEVKP